MGRLREKEEREEKRRRRPKKRLRLRAQQLLRRAQKRPPRTAKRKTRKRRRRKIKRKRAMIKRARTNNVNCGCRFPSPEINARLGGNKTNSISFLLLTKISKSCITYLLLLFLNVHIQRI